MVKILIVDDDLAVVSVLQQALLRHTTIFASDGLSALYLLREEKPDLVLLDLILPDIDGGLLVTRIRMVSRIPIIVLSSRQGQVDRIQSLQQGADDFIPKPFDLDNLDARIEAVLRRSHRIPAPSRITEHCVGGLKISNERGLSVNDKPVHVTPIQHRVLMYLIERRNEIVTRDDVAKEVWSMPDAAMGHVVDVHMARLRATLRLHDDAPVIATVRGRGFILQEAS